MLALCDPWDSSARTPIWRTRKRQCDEGRGRQFNPVRQHHNRETRHGDEPQTTKARRVVANAMGRLPASNNAICFLTTLYYLDAVRSAPQVSPACADRKTITNPAN